MVNEITPEQLLNNLEYAKKTEDTRVLILFLHLYTEHFIHRLAKEKQIKIGSFLGTIKVLKEGKIITEKSHEIIKFSYNLRNELIHHLNPNMKLFETWVHAFEVPLENPDEELLKIIEKSSTMSKINLIIVPNIIYLYQTLRILQNKEIDYDMKIKIVGVSEFQFQLYKKIGNLNK